MASTSRTGIITPWNKEIYNQYYITKTIEELADPDLIWEQFVPEETVSSTAIEWLVDGTSGTPSSSGRDTKKNRAPLHAPASEVPFVEISDLSRQTASTEELAIGIRFRERMRKMNNLDPVQRTMRRVSRWLAEQLNYEVATNMFGNFSVTNDSSNALTNASSFGLESTYGFHAGTLDAGKYWGTDGMDPLTDIEDLRLTILDQDGYNYNLTNIMMPIRMYSKVKRYLDRVDYDYSTSPIGGRNSLVLPDVGGVTITEARYIDGMEDNKILFWDASAQPATTFVFNDADGYGRWSEDARFYSHQWMDDSTGDLYTKLFTNRRTVLIEPKSVGVLQVSA